MTAGSGEGLILPSDPDELLDETARAVEETERTEWEEEQGQGPPAADVPSGGPGTHGGRNRRAQPRGLPDR